MASASELFWAPDLLFAEMSCHPDDPEWGEDNVMIRTIVALPASPVWQAHDGRERRLLTQNEVVLHHPGSEYRRERFRDVGYRCLFMIPAPSLIREIAAELDPWSAEDDVVRFATPYGPLDAGTFALSRMAAGYLRSPDAVQSAAREGLYGVLRGAVRASIPRPTHPEPVSPATRRSRRELAEGTKELLIDRMAERLSLDDVARTLYTTPYHLARVFRAATGFSVHGYLMHLRLRTGFDRLQSEPDGIGQVGRAVGYGSHSHFTASFRRAFGLAPSRASMPLVA